VEVNVVSTWWGQTLRGHLLLDIVHFRNYVPQVRTKIYEACDSGMKHSNEVMMLVGSGVQFHSSFVS
jgi:hypothetical protein